MSPHPDFVLFYHRLIEYYKPTPEASQRQLAAILERHFAKGRPEHRISAQTTEKGGIRT